jgi:ABC-type phosphate/phosphonate transport system substrate-binding protein
MGESFVLGAVAYDAKVVTIWDGFTRFFESRGLPFDYILFTSYERQVRAHFDGLIHVAWNSPLAWLQAERIAARRGRTARALAMRDTDCDLTSLVVAAPDSPIRELADLRGKRVGVGAADSPQATLIPLMHLRQAGLEPGRDFEVVRFDVLLGKHGDHIGGERDAARALVRGEVDAACMIDGNHLAFAREGTLPPGTRVLARTEGYDHCNFTVLDDASAEATDRFTELLLGMSYDDDAVRPLMDLEGLHAWKIGRTKGYAQLAAACDAFGTIDAFVDEVARA